MKLGEAMLPAVLLEALAAPERRGRTLDPDIAANLAEHGWGAGYRASIWIQIGGAPSIRDGGRRARALCRAGRGGDLVPCDVHSKDRRFGGPIRQGHQPLDLACGS